MSIFKRKKVQEGSFFHTSSGKQKEIVEKAVDHANIEQRELVDNYLRTK